MEFIYMRFRYHPERYRGHPGIKVVKALEKRPRLISSSLCFSMNRKCSGFLIFWRVALSTIDGAPEFWVTAHGQKLHLKPLYMDSTNRRLGWVVSSKQKLLTLTGVVIQKR